jgi:uncharacterized coiled-coil protein SlyX
MADERLSELESKMHVQEGRLKSVEKDISSIVDNIDRVESHLINIGNKPVNYTAIISAVLTFFGIIGTSIFGILNYVDLQLGYVRDQVQNISTAEIDQQNRIRGLSDSLSTSSAKLEERTQQHSKDIDELDQRVDELEKHHKR